VGVVVVVHGNASTFLKRVCRYLYFRWHSILSGGHWACILRH